MHRSAPSWVLLSLLLCTAPATAQLRIVHDTLSSETPTALTCGFCSGEQFGVVFRELPGRRGLEPTDFPLEIDTIEIGMGAANVESGACVPQTTVRTISAALAIYAGTELPTGDIRSLPEVGEWNSSEVLVWATDAAPLTLSVENAEGRYELTLNSLEIRDEMMAPVAVASGSYLRVVITLPEGTPGTSSVCTDPLVPPDGFPIRDNDGRIADERNFLYAVGLGWFWNEAAPGGAINGDWAIRLGVFPSGVAPGTDAGPPGSDAGPAATDGGAAIDDAGPSTGTDAGPETLPDDGCGCHAAGADASPAHPLLLGLLAGALLLRRRRSLRARAKLR